MVKSPSLHIFLYTTHIYLFLIQQNHHSYDSYYNQILKTTKLIHKRKIRDSMSHLQNIHQLTTKSQEI
jgi:hypothetical protein